MDISHPGRRIDGDDSPRPAAGPVDIGQRLRMLRHERSWTLLRASQQTGLSLSALSKIERGELSPTLSSLNKIAAGFGIDIVSLVDSEAPPNAMGRRVINRQSTGTTLKTKTCQNVWLAAELRHKRMLPIVTRVTARDPDEYAEWANHSGEIFLYVLSGTLVVHSRLYEPVRLKAHDSMYYDATADSKWTSHGKADAQVLWVYA
ncbi:MAG TPA: XRE family transcriptional regulator [Stellaceae bacterium]|nr:XRE family transcriptional regulator [Stellaceae bacterium]